VFSACGDKDPNPTDDTDEDGACGAVSTHMLTLTASVESETGAPVAEVAVWLEDRGWEPGTIVGQGTTDADGQVMLEALSITSVENCWGTLLDYVLVAEADQGRGEKEVNHPLYNAILDGHNAADVTAIPIVLK